MQGLILTAAPVSGGLQECFGDLPPGLVPLAGRPLLLSILQSLAEAGVSEVTVAVGHQAERVRALCARWAGATQRLHFVVIDPALSAGAALQQALSRLPRPGPVLVHLGDTLVPQLSGLLPRSGCALLTSRDVPSDGRWCGVDSTPQGRVRRFVNGGEAETRFPVAVGVYRIATVPAVWPALPPRPQISDVLLACAPVSQWRAVDTPLWHDVGHLDQYQIARKRVLSARSFNALSFDDFLGTVTKRSLHWQKLQSEVRWALALPPSLQPLAPRVFDFVPDGPQTRVTMEYYGYPSAAELWLYAAFGPAVLEGMLRRLCAVLDTFAAQPRTVSAADCDRLYRVKTEQRVAQACSGNAVLARIFDAPQLRINGVLQPGWRALWTRALPCVAALHDPAHGALVHGDFCLSNLLYDVGGGIVRLIDARGEWAAGDGSAGDHKYDLAKLRHSLAGGYDFIVSDLFDVGFDGRQGLTLSTGAEARHQTVAAAYDRWLAQRCDLRQVRLIESLLFLSMLPLHADRPRRQLAMAATGLRGLAAAVTALDAAPRFASASALAA